MLWVQVPSLTLFLRVLLVALAFATAACSRGEPAGRRPNVLFVVLDDLGAKYANTPNLDRLAARSRVFERAYAPAPLCNPSRTAVISGLAPWTSGVASNHDGWEDSPALASAVTLFEHFHRNGYRTGWSGKVYHERPGEAVLAATWDDREGADGNYGPFPTKRRIPADIATDDHVRGCYDYEEWTRPDSDFADVANVDRTIARLARAGEQPFFFALGLFRPHCPWTAPKRFFDLHPLDSVEVPSSDAADLDDLPRGGRRYARGVTSDEKIRALGLERELVRAYLASVSFMDWNLGRVLDALDSSPHAKNTIVVLWSDQGFDLGEKRHWGKNALWETTTRVPLLIAVPEKTHGERTAAPVSLLDLYPTLVELAGLPRPASPLDGVSLAPLVTDANARFDRPVVMSRRNKNFAVRDRRWRYILYKDGGEELYDHDADPDEKRNRAADPSLAAIKAKLAASVPKPEKPS